MIHAIARIHRDLLRVIRDLWPVEVKTLFTLLLQANPMGYLRTTPGELAQDIQEQPALAAKILEDLAARHLITVEDRGDALLVYVGNFLERLMESAEETGEAPAPETIEPGIPDRLERPSHDPVEGARPELRPEAAPEMPTDAELVDLAATPDVIFNPETGSEGRRREGEEGDYRGWRR